MYTIELECVKWPALAYMRSIECHSGSECDWTERHRHLVQTCQVTVGFCGIDQGLDLQTILRLS